MTSHRHSTCRLHPRALLTVLVLLLQSGCSVFGIRGTEQAAYSVIEQQDQFELRAYEPLVIAQTFVDSDFDQAGKIAFGRLFGYISGDNTATSEIAMTAPVMALQPDSEAGETISMTAPVTAEKSSRGWRFAFVLPAGYRLDNAPTPTSEEVTLATVPARRVAVKRYSGWWNEASYRENLQLLQDWMRQNKLEADSQPRYAGYDPPWTLPFLRRNEVMIDIRS